MEIISTPTKIVKCVCCDTKLKISNADLRKTSNSLVYGKYHTRCPVCGNRIYLNDRIKDNGSN